MPPYPTDFRDLRAFCSVVETGSISAAAVSLGETKGAVSRRIARIERELRAGLVKRGPRRTEPTDAGLAYYRHANDALQLLQRGFDLLHDAEEPSGLLRVNVSPGFAACVLGPLIGSFARRHPRIALDVVVTEDAVSLSTQDIDLAIRPAVQLPDSALIARKLLDWRGVMVATPTHLARHGAPATVDAIADRPLVVRLAPRDAVLREISVRETPESQPRRLPVPRATITTNTMFARDAALSGDCLALLPDFIVAREVEAGALLALLPRCTFEAVCGSIFLLRPPATFPPARVTAFERFLTEAMAERRQRAVPDE